MDNTNTLSPRQIAWLADNGIETWTVVASYGCAAGRVFVRGDLSVCAYRAGTWTLEARDDSEDGEGSDHIADFDTLRAALVGLAAA